MQRLQGDQKARLSKGPLGILGNYIVIDHGNNEHSIYAHLKPGSISVKAGEKVERRCDRSRWISRQFHRASS